jgi:hypothetical protein
MQTLTIEVPVELPADQVFTRLADAGGLGPFLSESVRPEATRGWQRLDSTKQRLSWQEGNTEVGGEVSVVDRKPGSCAVVIELRDADVIRTELQRAVAALAQQALADGDATDTGRAWH